MRLPSAQVPEDVWIARYIVSLCEPLIRLDSRIEIEQCLTAIASCTPHRVAAWGAGFLSDLVQSLDPDDPWRKLTVSTNGATNLSGHPFGSVLDATDVLRFTADDIGSDLGLAALEKPLEAESAALVALAGRGWRPTYLWMSTYLIGEAVLDNLQADRFWHALDRALRWTIHRRKVILGSDDPFIPVCGVQWLSRSSKIMKGEEWNEALAARTLQQAAYLRELMHMLRTYSPAAAPR